jgi:hypothetical protein
MPTKPIAPDHLEVIIELASNHGMLHKPAQILQYFKLKAGVITYESDGYPNSPEITFYEEGKNPTHPDGKGPTVDTWKGWLPIRGGKVIDPLFPGEELKPEKEKYENHPKLGTIKQKIGKNGLAGGKYSQLPLRKTFQFPRDMGPADNQVPWELAKHAMECTGLYLTEFNIFPSIGLARRYAQVAAVTQTTVGLSPEQIALRAEKLWFADLKEDTPESERPLSVYEQVELATKAWTQSDPYFVYKITARLNGIPEDQLERFIPLNVVQMSPLRIREREFSLVLLMPFFNRALQSSPLYRQTVEGKGDIENLTEEINKEVEEFYSTDK